VRTPLGRRHPAILDAFDGLRALATGRNETEFAHEPPGKKLDADFRHQKFPRGDKVHLVGVVAFAKQNVPFAIAARIHERLKPVDRQIALRRDARLLDEP
jgi:hypothetical protein